MANKQQDGILEAVHYAPDGQVDWARVYLRRGSSWSDRLILQRDELVSALKKGRSFAVGQRLEGLAGTFEVTKPVRLAGKDGAEVLVLSERSAERDTLDGVPVL